MGMKVPTLSSRGRFPWQPVPSLGDLSEGLSKSHLINITKGTFIPLITYEILRVLKALCQEPRKAKYLLLIINHNITSQIQKKKNSQSLRNWVNQDGEWIWGQEVGLVLDKWGEGGLSIIVCLTFKSTGMCQ